MLKILMHNTEQFLCSEFNECAHQLPAWMAQQESDTASDADDAGHFTLEYQSNPFASFIKEIEYLIENDPAQALRLMQFAVMEGLFDLPEQAQKLHSAMEETTEILKVREKEEKVEPVQNPATRMPVPCLKRALPFNLSF